MDKFRGEVHLSGETGWTKDLRLLSWALAVPNPSSWPGHVMEQPMATRLSVPVLAGVTGGCSVRLLLIGVRSLELEDFGGWFA